MSLAYFSLSLAPSYMCASTPLCAYASAYQINEFFFLFFSSSSQLLDAMVVARRSRSCLLFISSIHNRERRSVVCCNALELCGRFSSVHISINLFFCSPTQSQTHSHHSARHLNFNKNLFRDGAEHEGFHCFRSDPLPLSQLHSPITSFAVRLQDAFYLHFNVVTSDISLASLSDTRNL